MSSFINNTGNAGNGPSTSRAVEPAVHLGQPIPPYDPSEQLNSIEDFIQNIDEHAALNNWNEATTIFVATTNLKGLAKTWFQSLKRSALSWEEWKSLLRETFPEEVNYAGLLRKVVSRVKRPEETLLTYYFEKLALINAFDFDNKVAVSLLLDGLDREIYAAAKAGKHPTPASLLQFLKGYRQEARSEARPRDRSQRGLPTKKEYVKKPYARDTRSKTFQCFKCGRMGHIAPDCTLKQRDPPKEKQFWQHPTQR